MADGAVRRTSNSGDTNAIGRTFTVEVPQRYGFISVACAVYESDDETPNDRDLLLAEFARKVGAGAIAEPEDTFFEVLGESIAAGWKVGSVEAVAFRRSPTVEVRAYHRGPSTDGSRAATGWSGRWASRRRGRPRFPTRSPATAGAARTPPPSRR